MNNQNGTRLWFLKRKPSNRLYSSSFTFIEHFNFLKALFYIPYIILFQFQLPVSKEYSVVFLLLLCYTGVLSWGDSAPLPPPGHLAMLKDVF